MISCTSGAIQICPNDYDYFLYFYTNEGIAYLLPNEAKVHYLGSSALAYDHVYSDDFDNVAEHRVPNPIDAIKEIVENTGTGEFDEYGLEKRDPEKYPEFLKSPKQKMKVPGEIIDHDEFGIPIHEWKEKEGEQFISIGKKTDMLVDAVYELIKRIEALER